MAPAIGNPARGITSPVPGQANSATPSPRASTAPGPHAVRSRSLCRESISLFTSLAGFGAATLTFALSSNLATAGRHGHGAAALPAVVAGAAVGVWALFLLLWTIQSLRRNTPVWPTTIGRLLTAATAVQLATVIYGLWQVPAANRTFDLTAGCAVVLEMAMLASLGWLRRQPVNGHLAGNTGTTGAGSTAGSPTEPLPAGRLLALMFISAVLVAAVTTPGLAASTAGHSAVPHGSHGSQDPALHDPALHHH